MAKRKDNRKGMNRIILAKGLGLRAEG